MCCRCLAVSATGCVSHPQAVQLLSAAVLHRAEGSPALAAAVAAAVHRALLPCMTALVCTAGFVWHSLAEHPVGPCVASASTAAVCAVFDLAGHVLRCGAAVEAALLAPTPLAALPAPLRVAWEGNAGTARALAAGMAGLSALGADAGPSVLALSLLAAAGELLSE